MFPVLLSIILQSELYTDFIAREFHVRWLYPDEAAAASDHCTVAPSRECKSSVDVGDRQTEWPSPLLKSPSPMGAWPNKDYLTTIARKVMCIVHDNFRGSSKLYFNNFYALILVVLNRANVAACRPPLLRALGSSAP